MKETIQTNVGVEQDVVVTYGSEELRFTLLFDDYGLNWFFDLTNETTDEILLTGISLKLGNDALFGLGLDYGSLTLTDTEPTETSDIDSKADFGDRLKLVREFDA